MPELLHDIQSRKEGISQSGYGLRNVTDRVQMCLGDTAEGIVKIESRLNVY